MTNRTTDPRVIAQALEQSYAAGEPLLLLRPTYGYAVLPSVDSQRCPPLDFMRIAALTAARPNNKHDVAPISGTELTARGAPLPPKEGYISMPYTHIPKPTNVLRRRDGLELASIGGYRKGPSPLMKAVAAVTGPLAALRRTALQADAKSKPGSTSLCITTCAPLWELVHLSVSDAFSALGNRIEHCTACNTMSDGLALLLKLCDPVAAFTIAITTKKISVSAPCSPVANRQWRGLPAFTAMLGASTSQLAGLLGGDYDVAVWLKGLAKADSDDLDGPACQAWVAFRATVLRFVPNATDLEALVRSMAVIVFAIEIRLRYGDPAAFEESIEPVSERDSQGLRCLARLLGKDWAGDPATGDCDERSILRVIKVAPDPDDTSTLKIAFLADEVVDFLQHWLLTGVNAALEKRPLTHPQVPHTIIVCRTVTSSTIEQPKSSVNRAVPIHLGGGLVGLSPHRGGDAISSRYLMNNLATDMAWSWAVAVLELPTSLEHRIAALVRLLFQHRRKRTPTDSDSGVRCQPSSSDAATECALAAAVLEGGGRDSNLHLIHSRAADSHRSGPVPLEFPSTTETLVRHSFGDVLYVADPLLRPAASSVGEAAPRRAAPKRVSHPHSEIRPKKANIAVEEYPLPSIIFDEERRLSVKAIALSEEIDAMFAAARQMDHTIFLHVLTVDHATGPLLSQSSRALHSVSFSLGPLITYLDSRPRIAATFSLSEFCERFFSYLRDPSPLAEAQARADGGLDDAQFVALLCAALELPEGSFDIDAERIELTAAGVRQLERVVEGDAAARSLEAEEASEIDKRQLEGVRDLAYNARVAKRQQQLMREKEARRSAVNTDAVSPRYHRPPDEPPNADTQKLVEATSARCIPPWLRDPGETAVRLNRAAVARIQRAALGKATPSESDTPATVQAVPRTTVDVNHPPLVRLTKRLAAAAAAHSEARSLSSRSDHTKLPHSAPASPRFDLRHWHAMVGELAADQIPVAEDF